MHVDKDVYNASLSYYYNRYIYLTLKFRKFKSHNVQLKRTVPVSDLGRILRKTTNFLFLSFLNNLLC